MCISVRKKSTKEKNNNRVLLDTKKKKKEFIVRLWLELKQLTVFVARGIKGQSFSLFTSTIFSQLSLPRMLAALFHLYCLVSAWLAKNTGSFVSPVPSCLSSACQECWQLCVTFTIFPQFSLPRTLAAFFFSHLPSRLTSACWEHWQLCFLFSLSFAFFA